MIFKVPSNPNHSKIHPLQSCLGRWPYPWQATWACLIYRDGCSLRGFLKQPELAVLAAGGQDSGSPVIQVFDPKSVGASLPGQCRSDVGGEEWCGGMAPLCPACGPLSLALRNMPHLIQGT